MKTRQQVSITVLAAVSAACLMPGLANAQSTYRSDRNGNPVYDNQGRMNNGRPGDNARVSGTLAARQSRVTAGNTVTLVYTITNRGRENSTFRFPSSRMFDMEAVRVDVGANDRRGGLGTIGSNGNSGTFGRGSVGRRIAWRYSDDQLGAQMLTNFTLKPGESRAFLGRWQVDRNIPDGTYEVTAFLTPQRENRLGETTTRLIIENDRRGNQGRDNRDNRDDRDRGGRGGDRGNNGNSGNWNDRNGGTVDVTDLVRSNNDRYIDRRVTVRGIYRSNGSGNNSWLLDGDNINALVVTGPTPRNAKTNDRVTVSGTLRRSRDGRLTLQAD
ncbi:MAG: BsuPI-related putative proteinase inhibitor [Armatimonadota bacterium]